MSHAQMKYLGESRFVANTVVQHSHFRHIFKYLNNPTLEGHARDFVQAIVSDEFAKRSPANDPSKIVRSAPKRVGLLTPTVDSISTDQQYLIQKKENILRQNLDPDQIKIIRASAMAVAQASLSLCQGPMGIGYGPDKDLGTDKHVLSILEPHYGGHYGEIVLIFKQELMYHPDSNFSIQSATSFHSGNGYQWRQWLEDPGNLQERMKSFHHAKLHCSVPNYELAAALQLMASAGNDKTTTNIDLKTIINWWRKVNSHKVFKGHLPQLIPLDYIDHVYMPLDVFDTLTPDAQQSARSIFRHTLTISNEKGQAYEDFVYKETIKRIERNIEQASFPQGITITLPASAFDEHVLLPMTITQSWEIFSHTKLKPGFHRQPEITLIYWQAMRGDMMVTISNESIDCKQEQANLRCLICYVAEVPLVSTPDYHESYSYLSNDHPLKHSVISRQAKYKKGSCRFYRGVNIDDYLTFCLKIEYSKGRVSMFHAGANGIYNHEVIVAEFSKGELNLNKLDFVHVSAGNGTVPVKNMIIRHEPIGNLHPSFDTNFKGDTTTPTNIASVAQKSKAPPVPPDPKKEGFLAKMINIVGAPFSSTLKPCPESVNYLQRETSEHNKKYTHPCRYSELCRNIHDEPHLTHAPHNIPMCQDDRECLQLEDPIHRASHRHSKMANFLIPCHYQQDCRDTYSKKHRQMYSHGERVPVTSSLD